MKVLLFFSLLICALGNIYSQQTIKGLVTDPNGQFLEGATVLIQEKDSSNTLQFGTTDANGFFSIAIDSHLSMVILKITYFGFRPYVGEIVPANINSNTYVLKESISQLENVILKAEKKVIIRGDTTIYKTSKFLKGNEENLEDILKSVPNLDINSEGKITVNGKTINKLLIDGDDIYKNQHQFATNNLPSNIIGNIEVINNFKDFDALNSDKKTGLTALNVTIDEKSKGLVKGGVEAGVGIVESYKLNSTILFFEKKNKISIISKFNNVGESPLSIRDYFDLTSPVTINSNSNSSKVVFSTLDDVPKFLKIEDRATSRAINFSTLSHVFKTENNLKIDTYAIFNNANQTENNQINTILTNPDGVSRGIKEVITANNNNYFGTLKSKAIYKFNPNAVAILSTLITIDNSNQDTNTINEGLDEGSDIQQSFEPKKLVSNTNLNFKRKLSNGNIEINSFFNVLRFKTVA